MGRLETLWNPFDSVDPGALIKVVVAATDETVEAGRALGWEYPEPQPISALLDTGSPFTIVSRVFARNRKLPLTSSGTPIRTISGPARCDEHSCSISFPGSGLPRIGPMRVLATDFDREPFHCCILGRDVLKYWIVEFNSKTRTATISG